MTKIVGTAESFAHDALSGFCDAHAHTVRAVPGGVARANAGPAKVAVVIGGGSGHYPAFAGYVGAGLADAAVCGDVFASPSTGQVLSVVKEVNSGRGVLLTFGNYAGDVLNFGLAAELLAADGTDVRVVAVTDDIASAPAHESARRRGVAGDITVFKIAGAAAEAGYDLDGVERVARLANDNTRSFGVAFAGCTLPGAAQPLFEVPAGRMALGLGVHGEPGIAESALLPASELAALLVDRVLGEVPPGLGDGGARRVAVLLNGLGATKYEELFVLWGHVATRLRAAGLECVAPEVGELITSLDMAGCSLTVTWLDDETARLWQAPAEAPAFRRGQVAHEARGTSERNERAASAEAAHVSESAPAPLAKASPESAALAESLVALLERVAQVLLSAQDELGQLDAVAGDGDHGRGMTRGARSVLAAAGDAWADRAGGTSGALWGAALVAASAQLDDISGRADLVACIDAGRDAVLRLGGAVPGDKTMVDAIVPFATVFAAQTASGIEPATACRAAADAAADAAAATAQLAPRKGRAVPLGDRSLGHADPGAVSFALIAQCAAGP